MFADRLSAVPSATAGRSDAGNDEGSSGEARYYYGASGRAYLLPAGEADQKLLHLCGSIIQNISLHPDNRTRLYKAELAGGVSLERLFAEDAAAAAGSAAAAGRISPGRAASPPDIRRLYIAENTLGSSHPVGGQRQHQQRPSTAGPARSNNGSVFVQGARTTVLLPSSAAARIRPSTARPASAVNPKPTSSAANGVAAASRPMSAIVRPKALFQAVMGQSDSTTTAATTKANTLAGRPPFTQAAGTSAAVAAAAAAAVEMMQPTWERSLRQPPPSTSRARLLLAAAPLPAGQQRKQGGAVPTGLGGNDGDDSGDFDDRRNETEEEQGEEEEEDSRLRFLGWMQRVKWRSHTGGRDLGASISSGDGDDDSGRATATPFAKGANSKRATFRCVGFAGMSAGISLTAAARPHPPLSAPPFPPAPRKPMWDEHGDLIDSSRPEGSKALKQLLCRPVSHLWMDSPEARGRHGQVGGFEGGREGGEREAGCIATDSDLLGFPPLTCWASSLHAEGTRL